MKGWKTSAAALVAAAMVTPAAFAQQASSQMGGMAAHSPATHELYIGAVLFEKLEWGIGLDGSRSVARWDGQAWYGTDYDRIFIKTQGELERGRRAEEAEVQVLYSRTIGYFWNLQGGVRYDVRPRPNRTYGVIGVQGLAPGLFEVDLSAYVSDRGDVSFRAEASYDIYITQRLVLQPNVEVNFAIQRVPELGIGSGINDVEAGLRLRYEFTREVAPYIGVNYTRRIGDTARFARNERERVESVEFLTGIRLFF